MSAFEELAVMPEIIRAINDLGWSLPTAVQAESIPLILGGGDVLVIAETGSGKTGAFSLPILQLAHEMIRQNALDKLRQLSKIRSAGIAGKSIQMMPLDGVVVDTDTGLVEGRDGNTWLGTYATAGVKTGQYYFEVTIKSGSTRVGFIYEDASLNLGTDDLGFGYGFTGKKAHRSKFDNYGGAYAVEDVIGCRLMLAGGKVKVGYNRNGEDLGWAFEVDRAGKGPLFPAVSMRQGAVEVNLGERQLKHLPSGYKSILRAPSSETCFYGSQPTEQGADKRNPSIIILEPTRELADQVQEQITFFGKYLPEPVYSTTLCGATPIKHQIQQLAQDMDVIIGTPQRVSDLISKGVLKTRHVRFFVVDEADGIVDQGQSQTVIKIWQACQNQQQKHRVQVLLSSATLHSMDIRKLADRITQFPTWIDLKGGAVSIPDTLDHVVVDVDSDVMPLETESGLKIHSDGVHRKDVHDLSKDTKEVRSERVKLAKGLLLLKVIEALKMDQAMIFCRTRLDCDNLARFLNQASSSSNVDSEVKTKTVMKYSNAVLHRGLSKNAQDKALQDFKEGSLRFLICTDVAARGIHIEGLPFVVQMTLPDRPEDYVHRIGRTGRADRLGLAISLASLKDKEKVWYHANCPREKKGAGCFDTNLVEEGGCCMWFDECAYLKQIEDHIDTGYVERVTLDQLSGWTSGKKFGEKRRSSKAKDEDEVNVLGKTLHTLLAPQIRQLAKMEVDAQLQYYEFLNQIETP